MASRVTIAIINYQGKRWLPRCLASVAQLEGPVEEVLVIDNASNDGGIEEAQRQFPSIRVVKNRRNLGFAKACNQAMRLAQGDYVAILNNDLEVTPGWLTAHLRAMEAAPLAAATASKLLSMNPRHLVWGAGGCMNWQGFGYDRGHGEWDTGQYDRREPVFSACGAAMLIRRSAFEAIGPFDETFFMYHEDVDWCWRAWLLGFEVWYVPEAVAYHKGEGSSRRHLGEGSKAQLGYRHRLRSVLKYYEGPTLHRVLRLPQFWSYWAPTVPRFLKALPSICWNLRYLPSTLAQRRRIQRSRVRSDAQMSRWICQTAAPAPAPRLRLPRLMSGRCPKVSVVEAGLNDAAVLGSGWYHLEAAPHDPEWSIRWSQRSATLQLWQPAGATRLFLNLFSFAETSRCPVSGHVRLDGALLGRFASTTDEWLDLEFSVEVPKDRWITVTLELSRVWQPAHAFGNRDYRELGVALRRAGCTPPHPRIAVAPPHPHVSVILPTRNRAAVLEQTLRGLLDQTYPDDRLDIIVVDDGSTDDTAVNVRAVQALAPGRIRYLSESARGASHARNRGFRAASAALLLFLDDDIVPEMNLVAEHVAAHRRLNHARDTAVVGYTRWPLEQHVSAFLDYVGEDGPQFAYRQMREDVELSFIYCYSSNLSLYRETCGLPVLLEESLPFYWYDIELGYRLMQRGLRLYFHPRAVGYHHNVRSLKEFEVRQQLVGRYAVHMARWYPELAVWLGVARPRLSPTERLRAAAATLLHLTMPQQRRWLVRWYQWRLAQAYRQGVQAGRREPLLMRSLPSTALVSADRMVPEDAVVAAQT